VTHPLRKGLELTREHLREQGLYELQSYVDAVLAPRGWTLLRDSEQIGPTVALSLTITKGLKKDLKDAAAERDGVLDSLAEEGFRAALKAGWLPPKTVDKRLLPEYRTDPEQMAKAVLQLQVDASLRNQVQERAEEMTQRAGYRVTVSSVAVSWIADELGVERPTGDETRLMLLQLVPRTLAAHWKSAAEARGMTLAQVLTDGIRELRGGAWEMPRPVRAAKGTAPALEETTKLYARLDADLVDYLDEQAPVLAERFGRQVFPGKIALAILKDRLGEPAE
jgi:hypothetical protein